MPTVHPIVLRELDVPDAKTVRLEGFDLPFGRPHGDPAFTDGVRLTKSKRVLPGNADPIYQVRSVEYAPMELEGAFRDRRFSAGHARAMRDALHDLVRRGNLIEVSWGTQAWVGLLVEANIDVESPGDYPFKLSIDIARGPGASGSTPREPTPGPDMVARMRAVLAEDRAAVPPVTPSVLQRIRQGFDRVQAALDQLQSGMETAQNFGRTVTAGARRILALANTARDDLVRLETLYREMRDDVVGLGRSAVDSFQWWQHRYAVVSDLDAAKGEINRISTSQRQTLRSADRVYLVREGDTLESIAASQLGSALRAGDLGVRADELRPGILLRIPAVTTTG